MAAQMNAQVNTEANTEVNARVTVVAAARLHLGFLDLNGSLGRKFGGLGLSVSGPRTRLTLRPAARTSVEGAESGRARALLERAAAALARGASHRLEVHETIPAHSGLGSGTQLALAIAAALRRLHNLPRDTSADAALLERGARSGLGAGLFDQGGLVVDGGRGPLTLTPPVIARLPFPQEWRILLIADPSEAGLHGDGERDAFKTLPPFSDEQAGALCRLVLMQALPALAERDIASFGGAITRLQAAIGDYFAPAQRGRRFTSARVEALLNALIPQGATGIGQTSWGPTGFAFVESEAKAQELAEWARRKSEGDLNISIVEGLNRGAKIDAVYAEIA
jgi:beta-ribofuranosylaminobenzene 5'-phosphate synthase